MVGKVVLLMAGRESLSFCVNQRRSASIEPHSVWALTAMRLTLEIYPETPLDIMEPKTFRPGE